MNFYDHIGVQKRYMYDVEIINETGCMLFVMVMCIMFASRAMMISMADREHGSIEPDSLRRGHPNVAHRPKKLNGVM